MFVQEVVGQTHPVKDFYALLTFIDGPLIAALMTLISLIATPNANDTNCARVCVVFF